MEKILLCIIALSFIIGAIDYIEGNKFDLGNIFEDNIKKIGNISLRILGFLSLIPFISEKIQYPLNFITNKLLIDSSIIIGSIVPMHIGGYNICMSVAKNYHMGIFAATIVSAMCGETISSIVPSVLKINKNENIKAILKGIICGIISMPISFLIMAIIIDIPVIKIIYNLLPVILFLLLVILGIVFYFKRMLIIFEYIYKAINFISIIGLIIQGVYTISGIMLIDNIMPIDQVLIITIKMALFLCGSYIMIEILKRLIKSILGLIDIKDNIYIQRFFILLESMVSSQEALKKIDNSNYNTQIICSAFLTTGAYALSMQLGYVAATVPKYIGIFVLMKIMSGLISIVFAQIFLKYENKI